MKKKDLNEIAKIEKAIAKKFGTETIVNPKAFWTNEKEEEYLEQVKEFYKDNTKARVTLQFTGRRNLMFDLGTGRDKRAEEMAKVNIGRDQDIYGQSPMNRETYNLWSGLANTPGEYQAMAKKMVGWVDQMGGPDLGPYKKMLAQGLTRPPNKYT